MKTKHHHFLLIAISLLLLLAPACDQGFEELQENPNSPTSTNPDYLFTESVVTYSSQGLNGIYSEIWTLMEWMMMKADINGLSQAADAYAYGGSNNDALWQAWYVNALSNIQAVIRSTENDPTLSNKYHIARIWRAYIFHRITDLWGDVPYYDALNGYGTSSTTFTPKYDTQATIYTNLLQELLAAANALDDTKISFSSGDPFYGGSVKKWQRFAHSLRLRLAIRMSNVKPNEAQAAAEESIASNLLISNNDEGAHFPYNSQTRSAFFDLYDTNQGFRYPSHFLANLLLDNSDPRLGVYASPTQESAIFGGEDYTGIPNLLLSTELADYNDFNTSSVGNYFLSATTKGSTLAYAEVCFLLAEAALKGWNTPLSAAEYYNNGVQAAMQRLEVDSEEIADYLANTGSFNQSLEQIITQKWITFVYLDAYEAFAEYRRTGFPKLQRFDGTLIAPNNFPQRFPYPDSEINLNNQNVSAVGVGINEKSTPVWWAN